MSPSRKQRGQPRRKLRAAKAPKGKRVCNVEGCGRPLRSKGFCQTHYKQMRKHGRIRPIKAKRAPRADTVRFSGLSVTEQAAELLAREAKRRNIAANALITDILEDWMRRRR